MITELYDQDRILAKKLLTHSRLPVSDIDTVDWYRLIGWGENGTLVGVAGMEQCGSYLLLSAQR